LDNRHIPSWTLPDPLLPGGFVMTQTSIQSPASSRKAELLTQSLEQLRRCLAADSTGRERAWVDAVGAALEQVNRGLRQHAAGAVGPDGLFTEVDATRPGLARQTDELSSEQSEQLKQLRVLREEVSRAAEAFRTPSTVDVGEEIAAIRQLAEQLLAGIQQNQDAETSLVFESVNTDIGGGD